jgi:chloride channel protein, CIC family
VKAQSERRAVSLAELALLALAIGIVTGLAAVLFRAFVAGVHNLALLGQFSLYYNPNLHTPAGWLGPVVILSPAIGGMAVVFIMLREPADRRGQGVSDIMDAIYYREGRVRSLPAVAKSVAAGIQSATGGSVGREAAIVQIGAAVASRMARLTNIAQWQRMTLAAAGSAAGLAAAFNAPLGSIVFAVELMMPEISARTLLPVTVAAGAGTFVARFFYGLQPTFLVETMAPGHLRLAGIVSLLPFVALGVLLGLTSWLLIWSLGWSERVLGRLVPHPYLRHGVGMIFVGALAYGLMRSTGHYYIAGPSYAELQDILRGDLTAGKFLLLLFALKLAASVVTIGSGGSGGVFSASMVIGASLGGAFGAACLTLWPGLEGQATDFAIVGMAGLLGGTTGAAITAIVMVFELTRDYNVIVPLILGVTLALAVRRAILPESVYTQKLVKKGHEVPDMLQANMWGIRHAARAMSRDFAIRSGGETLNDALAALAEIGRPLYLMVAEGQRLRGYVRLDPGFKLWQARNGGTRLADLARSDFVLARPEDPMSEVIGRMARRNGSLALVVDGGGRIPRVGDIRGVVTPEIVGEAAIDNLRPYTAEAFRNPLPQLYRRRVRPFQFWRSR